MTATIGVFHRHGRGSPRVPYRALRRLRAGSRAGQLRREGARVKLQDQPLRMLALLLERPGELVTRDELRTRLWPADTFVDFDLGLNTAVRKLRQALDDSAESPRFVETVPKHGYRFIGAVDRAEPSSLAPSGFPCHPWYASDPLLRPLHGQAGFDALLEELRRSREAAEARYPEP